MDFSIWLNNKFLDWERETGKHQTITSFAKYLNVPYIPLLSWLHGNFNPSLKNLNKIAAKLGTEAYIAAGLHVRY